MLFEYRKRWFDFSSVPAFILLSVHISLSRPLSENNKKMTNGAADFVVTNDERQMTKDKGLKDASSFTPVYGWRTP